MSSKKYTYEIYIPGSTDDVWVVFYSDTPFIPLHRGDLLNPGLWEGSQSPMKILRVLNVEHLLWESDSIVKQKVMIYSEEVDVEEEQPRLK